MEGGVEKHCEMLYPLLDNDAEVIVFRRKPYVRSERKYDNIRFIDLPSTKIKGFEALIHSFMATGYSIFLKPDLVHIHNIGPGMFIPMLKFFSIHTVLTYHSPNYEHKKWGGVAKALLKLSERISLKYADRVIFVNRFQMEKYPEWTREKSVYIPNGICKPMIPENSDFLQKIGVEPRKYILSVGRITPEKGFHTLIRAFRKMGSSGYKLVIAGGVEFESGYMQELRKLAEGLPVIFTGYVFGEALAQLYANASLFVLASENEGFPLVLLEAMSYGRDLVVSDIPATHLVNLLEEDYFCVGDADDLANRIKEKLQFPRLREHDLSEYDWKSISKQVFGLFEEITS